MGLDCYALTRVTAPATQVKIVEYFPAPPEVSEEVRAEWRSTHEGVFDEIIYEWRYHWDLYRWMWELYLDKGGEDDRDGEDGETEWNVVLTASDLDRLEVNVIAGLPHKECDDMYYRSADPNELRENDLAFVTKARAALAEGKTVYFTESW